MLVVYKRVEKERKVEIEKILEKNLKIKENKIFTYTALSFKGFFLENSLNNFLKDVLEKSNFLNRKDNWKMI